MSELYPVFMFCAFYSGVVIFSLWMTVTESGETNNQVPNRKKAQGFGGSPRAHSSADAMSIRFFLLQYEKQKN